MLLCTDVSCPSRPLLQSFSCIQLSIDSTTMKIEAVSQDVSPAPSKQRKVCGLGPKNFSIAIISLLLIAIGLGVGLGVGLTQKYLTSLPIYLSIELTTIATGMIEALAVVVIVPARPTAAIRR